MACAITCLHDAEGKIMRTKTNSVRPITYDDFMKAAKVAGEDGCLKQRQGQYGKEWLIMLNGHVMMAGIINEDGEREFFQYY